MLCENCKENLATAFSSVFENDVQKELYLCQKCLNKKQLSSKFQIQNINQKSLKACVCGASFKEIAETGFVSCKDCYKTFEEEFEPYIFTLHLSNEHKGKRKFSKIELLSQQLEKARKNNFVSLALKIESEISKLKGEPND